MGNFWLDLIRQEREEEARQRKEQLRIAKRMIAAWRNSAFKGVKKIIKGNSSP